VEAVSHAVRAHRYRLDPEMGGYISTKAGLIGERNSDANRDETRYHVWPTRTELLQSNTCPAPVQLDDCPINPIVSLVFADNRIAMGMEYNR
jgi:hypothetical protein